MAVVDLWWSNDLGNASIFFNDTLAGIILRGRWLGLGCFARPRSVETLHSVQSTDELECTYVCSAY